MRVFCHPTLYKVQDVSQPSVQKEVWGQNEEKNYEMLSSGQYIDASFIET